MPFKGLRKGPRMYLKKKKVEMVRDVSKVHTDNSCYSDMLDVKFDFWLAYANHVYVFLCVYTYRNKPYVAWIREQNWL